MVKSSVEYIDQEVEGGADATSDEEVDKPVSWVFSLFFKMLFPVAVTVFALMYLSSVLGRIRLSNLYYPLFVFGTMLALLASVYVMEALRIRRIKNKYDVPLEETLRELLNEWWQAIGLVGVILVYMVLIPILGFFPSTFLTMIAAMVLGGNRNPILITGTTVGLLLIIYLLFVVFINMSPPEGPFAGLF